MNKQDEDIYYAIIATENTTVKTLQHIIREVIGHQMCN